MPTALFLSPHLDDVAFSCGGTLLRLADDPRWRVVLCTLFTATVAEPQGFALRCQTDKGLAPEVDYMALRREEDTAYARAAAVDELWHGPHREAPHRGYDSPAALFAGARRDDVVWQALRDDLAALQAAHRPDVTFAPQGLGNHVDHLQTIRAVLEVYPDGEGVCWYRDTPYAIREPDAQPATLLAACSVAHRRVAIDQETLARKIAGCSLYASQIGFQFGGSDDVREKLTAFHHREAGAVDAYAENLLAGPGVPDFLPT